jgi:hypothetical protein
MNFWPSEINSDEVQSPKEIMQDAGMELEKRTGILAVSIQESQLDDRVVLAFEVSKRASKVMLNLFEASHGLKFAYPVVIVPPERDIPEFLRRERYVPGTPGMLSGLSAVPGLHAAIQGMPGRYVENKWVCGTPSEFREKLTGLFAEDHVKSRIVSLLAANRLEERSKPKEGDAENEISEEENEERG